jgi:ArsR family transcriptional regulator
MKGIGGYQRQAQLFRALSHPVRLHILDILSRQEACVCHLTAILGKRQPYVSQQLGTLREAGLVTDRRDGTLIYYSLANEHLADLLNGGKIAVQDLTDQKVSFPSVPDGALADCPCPRCAG